MTKHPHLTDVPKLIESPKFWCSGFGTGFGTAGDAEDPFVDWDEGLVPEAFVIGTPVGVFSLSLALLPTT